MQRSRRPHGPEKGGEDEDLMSWIETPSSPLPDDRFTRRPSLEPENGELVIRMRPSTGSTAQTSEQQDGAHASSKGVSLVLSAKRRTPVKPFDSSAHTPTGLGDALVRPPSRVAHSAYPRPESASRAGRPGSALRFPGSSLSTVYREAKPASAEDRSGTGGQGSAREYARPSSAARSGRTFVRPLSASKFGREDAARPSSARLRPASSETISHGYSTSAGSRPDPWRGGRDGQVEIMVNEEGEPSPDMVSPPARTPLSKSSDSPYNLESPDDFYCTRKSVGAIRDLEFSRAESRQARLRLENEELTAVLQEGRKLMRPLSGSLAKRSPTSEYDDTSPLALGSAPVFRPTPPMSAKSEESPPRVATAGIRLPPVFNASPSQVSPPLHSAPEFERGESFAKSSQKRSKTKTAAKKKANAVDDVLGLRPLRAQGGESERGRASSPLGSPVGASPVRRVSPTRPQPAAGAMRKAASSIGLSSAPERGLQRLGSPLHTGSPLRGQKAGGQSPIPGGRERSQKVSGGQSPIPGALGARQRSTLSSPLMASPTIRFLSHGHGAFDPSRPCLYVCQRDRRGSVLSRVTDLRGIYRSIMQAIKQAVDGDTIQVLSGIYEENIVIETSVYIKPVPGEEVTIRSENLATINSSAMTAKIEDITLEHTGGNASLKGQQGVRCVEVHEGDLELNNCDVTCNVGSGVMLLEQAYLKVKKSRINDNGRCGIISFDESRLDCEDSQFKDNNLNGIDLQTGSIASLTRCTINRNGQTGLLVSDSDTYATAVDCAISENDRRGVTAQHQGAFQLRGCNVTSNRDLGVLLLGDASPCTCLFVNSNITGNSEGALTIHGSVPDTSSCHIEGEVKLLHTPPARPSPIEPARQFAGANTIQSAWRCHQARLAIRRQVQVYLARIAEEAAAAEAERAENERQHSPCRSSPDRDCSPDATSEGRQERLEGMEALEADILDTFNRFDKLGSAMDDLLAQAATSE